MLFLYGFLAALWVWGAGLLFGMMFAKAGDKYWYPSYANGIMWGIMAVTLIAWPIELPILYWIATKQAKKPSGDDPHLSADGVTSGRFDSHKPNHPNGFPPEWLN